ncbi:hypothetical protein [Belnapia rosea]|uniref:Uncharacterized protein n=1 Tax=Belnapia rosea TaxID=938405 RepID=A0A1G6TGY7_9PROT|nr:hypothetical protein [Belnapia rosea]SDD28358.1 hypothetical protein SAMN04487779_100671 [Belnapia rosea]
MPSRRHALLAPLALAACANPLPEAAAPGHPSRAAALLAGSAEAHGLGTFRRIRDVSLRYEGEWPPVIGRLQPVLVDQGFRGGSEERLLPREGLVAQAHAGPAGSKQVVRRPGAVRVWFNGVESEDAERQAAAALVADGYLLFLLGPMLLAGGWPGREAPRLELAGEEEVEVGGIRRRCDLLRASMVPGLGASPAERLLLFIDREERLMRRVRFGLEGLRSTRGAVAEVDAWDHVTLGGVRWPRRFHERLLRPLPLPVHDWRLTGLDLDRGIAPREIEGPAFTGRAVAPAA